MGRREGARPGITRTAGLVRFAGGAALVWDA